MNVTSKYF